MTPIELRPARVAGCARPHRPAAKHSRVKSSTIARKSRTGFRFNAPNSGADFIITLALHAVGGREALEVGNGLNIPGDDTCIHYFTLSQINYLGEQLRHHREESMSQRIEQW